MFYYGSHGGKSAKEGWEAGWSDRAIYGGELREGFGRRKCHVIASISTCGSGGFGRPGPNEFSVPPNLTALCAYRHRQHTGSQLDIAFCEALSGFADRNDDGEVTLQEVINYLPLRYREMLSEEERNENPEERMPVIIPSTDKSTEVTLTRSQPERLAVVKVGTWRGALSLAVEDKRYKVRFLGWAREELGTGYSMPDAEIGPNHIDQPGGFPPAVYKAEAGWVPAVVVSQNGKSFEIRIPGQAQQGGITASRTELRALFGNRAFRVD